MDVVEVFFAFYRRPPLEKLVDDPWRVFGHVEAFGITLNQDWFFFDPTRRRLNLRTMHRYDDVVLEITKIEAKADLILRFEPIAGPTLPPLCPMTCASQCAHLAGVRAFTIRGLERTLRAHGAKEIARENPRGRSQGKAGAA